MANFTDLVPPLELCKKIPTGEFADSALIWMNGGLSARFADIFNTFPPSIVKTISPAPTLDEIMDKCKDIPSVLNPTLWWQGIWEADCAIYKSGKLSDEFFDDADIGNFDLVCAEDKSAATAALKLWLKLKGIEDGK